MVNKFYHLFYLLPYFGGKCDDSYRIDSLIKQHNLSSQWAKSPKKTV